MDRINWNVMEKEDFLSKVYQGEIDIHQPIPIKNESGDMIKHVSFLSYLLEYPDVYKDNFHHVCMIMFREFYNQLQELLTNETVKSLYTKFLNHWKLKEPIIESFNNPFTEEKTIQEMINEAYSFCESTMNKMEDVPLESQLMNESPYKREVESSVIICNQTLDKLKSYYQSINQLKKQLSMIPLNVFIMLSFKHRNHYLLLDPKADIPDNIHQIFLNYIYIQTMFHQELLVKSQMILDVVEGLKKPMREVNDINHNMETLQNQTNVLQEGQSDGEKPSFF